MKKKIIISCSCLLVILAMQTGVQAQSTGQNRQPLSPVRPVTGEEPPQLIKGDKEHLLGKVRRNWQGHSPQNPILPARGIKLDNGGQRFTINVRVTSTETTIWIDPVVAVGYDYSVEKGPRFTAVELIEGIGDNSFDLWTYNDETRQYVDSGVDIKGGTLYTFKSPVNTFSIRGIEKSAELAPDNETAFPTGLRFEKTGKAVVTMTSIPEKTRTE